MRHLTEEEIQAHLDGSDLDPELRDHLGTCIQCREVLGGYRALYADLADDVAFSIPQDLAGTVTSRLRLRQTRRRLRVSGDLVLVASGILAMLVAVSVFVDLASLFDTISVIGRQISDYTSPGLESARNHLASANRTFTIPVAGVTILAVMWVLDIAFKRRRPNLAGRGR